MNKIDHFDQKVTIIKYNWSLNCLDIQRGKLAFVDLQDWAQYKNSFRYIVTLFRGRKQRGWYVYSARLDGCIIIDGYYEPVFKDSTTIDQHGNVCLMIGGHSDEAIESQKAQLDKWLDEVKPTILYDMRTPDKLRAVQQYIKNSSKSEVAA